MCSILLKFGDDDEAKFTAIERVVIGIFGLICCRFEPDISAARPQMNHRLQLTGSHLFIYSWVSACIQRKVLKIIVSDLPG